MQAQQMRQVRPLRRHSSTPPEGTAPGGQKIMHAHVGEPELHRCGVTPAQLHQPRCWLLREPNGLLLLSTLAPTPAGARALARPILDSGAGSLPPSHRRWSRWRALGYEIVHPVGPYFHSKRPDDCWGRRPAYRLLQTQVCTASAPGGRA